MFDALAYAARKEIKGSRKQDFHMDKVAAEKITLMFQASTSILDSLLCELNEQLSPDEFQICAEKFGKIIDYSFAQVLDPLWRDHPDLLPEKLGGTYKINSELFREIYQQAKKLADV